MKTETSNIRSKAIFSDDGEHRLLLWKEWDKDKPTAMIIMINPSTADTLNMDLTTMLTINNLNVLGYGSVNIVNLYSRITNKLSLRFNSDEDLLDENNDGVIVKYAEKSDVIIIAWGCVGNHSQRIREIIMLCIFTVILSDISIQPLYDPAHRFRGEYLSAQ